jgi:hypothetical protein
MAKKKEPKAKKRNPNSITIATSVDGTHEKAFSDITVDPSVQSAMTVKRFGVDSGFRDVDLDSMVETLSEQIEATNSNDLANLEGMLTGQAYALNAIFNRLTQIASWNIDDHLKGAELLLKLGLRAQSQCRTTIEAISAVKNPPMMGYVKQANITQGPQQVNNGIDQDAIPRAGENQNPKNELLEKQDGNQLDTGTQSEAISDDSAMETVGKVNGANDARG